MLKSRQSWLLLATALFAVVCVWTVACVRSASWYIAETRYAQIKEGMAIEEVEAIMGTSHSIVYANVRCFAYGWRFGNSYSVVATFAQGDARLVSKSINRPASSWEWLRSCFAS